MYITFSQFYSKILQICCRLELSQTLPKKTTQPGQKIGLILPTDVIMCHLHSGWRRLVSALYIYLLLSYCVCAHIIVYFNITKIPIMLLSFTYFSVSVARTLKVAYKDNTLSHITTESQAISKLSLWENPKALASWFCRFLSYLGEISHRLRFRKPQEYIIHDQQSVDNK